VKRSLETGPEERHKVELKEVKKGAFTEKGQPRINLERMEEGNKLP